jgi:hypothetical protein
VFALDGKTVVADVLFGNDHPRLLRGLIAIERPAILELQF